MSQLKDKRLILGVCGSVAAFKSAALASDLVKMGATVRVILTESGERFVGRETFRDLTDQPVATELWDADMDHIQLAQWADAVIVVPATANLIARSALGLANDLLSTVLLATPAPVLLAPAMESRMWEHVATRRNMETLRERGVLVIGPESGRLASGASGAGRMAEPAAILAAINELFDSRDGSGDLAGVHVLVTAGPTEEPIDPVRFISNRSSGKMGYALAAAAVRRGAQVMLITGPVDSALTASLPAGITRVPVVTAADMRDAVLAGAPHAQVLIMAAAVADFQPARAQAQKVKKRQGITELELKPTEDILSLLAARAPGLVRIGFAAETENLVAHAEEKLRGKDLAMIVANDVSGDVFGADDNEVTILRQGAEPVTLPRMSKQAVAERIVDLIPTLLDRATR